MAKHVIDPQRLQSRNPDDFGSWFQYRADVLTGFIQRLRQAVQEQRLGPSCPIILYVPDNSPWSMIAYGLDIERWCAEDLIYGLMLSPFPLCGDDLGHYHTYHVKMADRHNKICIGSLGSKKLVESQVQQNTGFFTRSRFTTGQTNNIRPVWMRSVFIRVKPWYGWITYRRP